MFSVEVRMSDDPALTERMATMRTWLDHHRFEPSTFRHTFVAQGIIFRVEFKVEAEATMFAKAFAGRLIGSPPMAA